MTIRGRDAGAALAAQAVSLMETRLLNGMVVTAAVPAPKETLKQRFTREAEELAEAIAELAGQRAKRVAQLAELERYPDEDPYQDDTVLRFKKVFPGSDKLYTYTASRYDGHWYLSGVRSPDALTWDELAAWMGLGVSDVTKIAPGRAAKVAWSDAR